MKIYDVLRMYSGLNNGALIVSPKILDQIRKNVKELVIDYKKECYKFDKLKIYIDKHYDDNQYTYVGELKK